MKPVDDLSDDELGLLAKAAAALPDAPASWVRAAVQLWPAAHKQRGLGASAGTLLGQVIAVLTLDSWAPATAALAMRALSSEVRHLLFSASGRDIDLRITPQAEGFALAGQVLGPDEAGQVELSSIAEPPGTRVAELDALGEFRLDDVGRGSYRLVLRVGAQEIVLPLIEVGEGRP
jgi:hypothetical protein